MPENVSVHRPLNVSDLNLQRAPYGLREVLGPVVGFLFEVRTDPECPLPVSRRLFPICMELVELVTDDDFCIVGATPEQRATLLPTPTSIPEPSPYALAAYAGEIHSVQAAMPSERHTKLRNAAYALGRFVAAGELPADHVLQSLLAAAPDLTSEESQMIIKRAFQQATSRPRNTPKRGGWS